MSDHTVTYDEANNYIMIEYNGDVNLGDVNELRLQAIALMKRHDCNKTLTNLREGLFDLSTMEIYEMPESAAKAFSDNGLSIGKVKRALLVYNDVGAFTILETISKNQGQAVRIFHNLEEAQAWLMED